MAKSLFPEEMMKSTTMDINSIAGKLISYHTQLRVIHWQTLSFAEHKATDELIDKIGDFIDNITEKLIGYTGARPKSLKIESPKDNVNSSALVKEIGNYAYKIYLWAGEHDYCDVENMAQELSGDCAKVNYLLTLS